MKMNTLGHDGGSAFDSTTMVYIIGKNQLQNDLLQSFIESQECFACASETELRAEILKMNDEGHLILILDSSMADVHFLNKNGNLTRAIRQSHCHPILFNVKADQGIEKKAIQCGIKGVFYCNDPKEHLIKGLHAVLAGELWFPRKVISDYILTEEKHRLEDDGGFPQVTLRERQILAELSKGASNQEIADNLHISQHTVKTHIYNCYRKIGVSNRLQATIWASRHL
jgi:LuxR family transcriptional regulator, positive regulator of biofilm formation